MRTKNRPIEVLAPAGSMECLKAAILNGADAVYLGGEMFGARAYAGNFNKEELLEAIDYVHLYGKKLFLTVNTLMKLLQDAAKVLATAGFDMEIVEKHHRLKLDAPSGTALALADSINEAMDNQYHYIYDRSQRREMRDDKEIGISAVRGGTIVGEHEVIFAGPDEVIEFKHTAYSKAVFGKGAVEAAKFLAGKPAGRYDMSDVISAK